MTSLSRLSGPLLIALATFLWASDALFRYPTVQAIHPVLIVFLEHLIALTVLAPLALWFTGRTLWRLESREWLWVVLIGAGSSGLATILFTGSFRYVNPSVSILLQKLQPVICVVFAMVLLREKPRPMFYLWAVLALAAGVVISFPDLDFGSLGQGEGLNRLIGILCAFGAALLWAFGTVGGRAALRRLPPLTVTFWRFMFGLAMLGVILAATGLLAGNSVSMEPFLKQPSTILILIYMGLFPGLLAMFTYYRGLRKTRASVATFVELLFPVCAIILNMVFLELTLEPVQLIAGGVLLISVTFISVEA